MKTPLKISVIIPTYNRRNCIINAVNSVLKQDISKIQFETIVVDGNSNDGTDKLFKKIKNKNVKYIHLNYDPGANGCRNIGIKKSTGNYILLLDSDDILSPDFSKIISKYKNYLTYLNFFGTAEANTNKKMYYLGGNGFYNYKDLLSGKKFRGEMIPLVKKIVFKSLYFDENVLYFESFFYNKVIKKYGFFAVDEICRLYNYDQKNRASKKLMDIKNSKKRYEDYKKYLDTFGVDYLKYKLYKKYSEILLKIGMYATISGNVKEGRRYFMNSIRYNFSFENLFLLILSYSGHKIFLIFYKTFIKFIKV